MLHKKAKRAYLLYKVAAQEQVKPQQPTTKQQQPIETSTKTEIKPAPSKSEYPRYTPGSGTTTNQSINDTTAPNQGNFSYTTPSYNDWNENDDGDFYAWMHDGDRTGYNKWLEYTKDYDEGRTTELPQDRLRNDFWQQYRAGKPKVVPNSGSESPAVEGGPSAFMYVGDTRQPVQGNIIRSMDQYYADDNARFQQQQEQQRQQEQQAIDAWQRGDADFFQKYPEMAKHHGYDTEQSWKDELARRGGEEVRGQLDQRRAQWDQFHKDYEAKVGALDPNSPTYLDDYNALYANYENEWNRYQNDMGSIESGEWNNPTPLYYNHPSSIVEEPQSSQIILDQPSQYDETPTGVGLPSFINPELAYAGQYDETPTGVGLPSTPENGENYTNQQWYETLSPENARLYTSKLQTHTPEEARRLVEEQLNRSSVNNGNVPLSPYMQKIYEKQMKMHGNAEVALEMAQKAEQRRKRS